MKITLFADLKSILPELLLLAGVLIGLLYGAIQRKNCYQPIQKLVMLSVVGAIFSVIKFGFTTDIYAFDGQIHLDYFADLARVSVLTILLLIFIFQNVLKVSSNEIFETPLLYTLTALGACVCVIANDFLILFMGIELMSLPLMIIIAKEKSYKNSAEAAIKYYNLAAVGSCFLLFGISMIYGSVGHVNFNAVAAVYGNKLSPLSGQESIFASAGVVMVLLGLVFKIAAAPLHAWSAEIFEGTPFKTLLLFSTLPKVTIVFVLIRLVGSVFVSYSHIITPLLSMIAVLSMVFGSLSAFSQEKMKRFFAFAATSNMGFVLMGIALCNQIGSRSALIFMLFYVVATLALFATLSLIKRNEENFELMDDFSGFQKVNASSAFVIAFCLLSMGGIPPLPGFIAKLGVLHSVLGHSFIIVPIVAVLVTVISVAYYLSIIKKMYFDHAITGAKAVISSSFDRAHMMIFMLVAFLIVIALTPGVLVDHATKATARVFF